MHHSFQVRNALILLDVLACFRLDNGCATYWLWQLWINVSVLGSVFSQNFDNQCAGRIGLPAWRTVGPSQNSTCV